MVAGLAVALDSLCQFAALAVLYGVLRWGVVAREEAYLTRKFGDPYLDYARRVRRWLYSRRPSVRGLFPGDTLRFRWLARPDCDSF